MRTTLTLDKDVAERLQAEVTRTDRAFKQVVNDALRRGLQLPTAAPAAEPYRVEPLPLEFRPGIDPDKLNELADELETGVLVQKLRS